MLCVVNKPIMLSWILLSVVLLNVIMLNVVVPEILLVYTNLVGWVCKKINKLKPVAKCLKRIWSSLLQIKIKAFMFFGLASNRSGCPSVCLSACLPVCLSACQSVCLPSSPLCSSAFFAYHSVCILHSLFVHLSFCLFVYLFLSNCLSVCVSICVPVHISVGFNACLFLCMFFLLYVFPSVCFSFCMSIPMYVYPYVCLSLCMPIPLCVYSSACLSLYTSDHLCFCPYVSESINIFVHLSVWHLYVFISISPTFFISKFLSFIMSTYVYVYFGPFGRSSCQWLHSGWLQPWPQILDEVLSG